VQPRKSGRGCLIALGVVGVVMLVIGLLVAVAIWKFASTVKDVAEGVTVGDVECPTEEKVSDIVGHTVELATSIDVGDGGKAFGAPMRSEAATKSDGHIVEVDIFSEGTEPIGDKRDEAVEILELYLALND
jgi:hypothetical protein